MLCLGDSVSEYTPLCFQRFNFRFTEFEITFCAECPFLRAIVVGSSICICHHHLPNICIYMLEYLLRSARLVWLCHLINYSYADRYIRQTAHTQLHVLVPLLIHCVTSIDLPITRTLYTMYHVTISIYSRFQCQKYGKL